jgi:endoglucanase
VEVTPGASAVSASTNDGNLPANVVDNDLASRWSANGDGQWIQLDLGSLRTVSRVSVAVYNGNTRQNRFDLQTSTDNSSWSTVLANLSSSGTTTAEESYNLGGADARWVRYLGHGNTVNAFNSVTEISVFASTGTPTATPTPTPTPTSTPTPTPVSTYVEVTPTGSAVTASTNDGNLPGNVVDNNLATRWSANGDGQWLQLDLGSARTIGYVKVGVYNGNTRGNIFELQVSSGSGLWTTVWSGQSSGATTAEETYDMGGVSARWVRYLGHMNTANTFNSVTEISVFAAP